MSIAEQQPSTTTSATTTDPDLAKFAAGSVVHVIGDSEQRKYTIIERHFLWSKASREYHYRLFRDLGNGMAERVWKRESEIEGDGMIAYVTKYALTRGILVADGEVSKLSGDSGEMLTVRQGHYLVHYHSDGDEWHENYAQAVKQAEQRRVKKIASLRKQLAKLEALTFPSEAPEVKVVGK